MKDKIEVKEKEYKKILNFNFPLEKDIFNILIYSFEKLRKNLEDMFFSSYQYNIEYRRWCVRSEIYEKIKEEYEFFSYIFYNYFHLLKKTNNKNNYKRIAEKEEDVTFITDIIKKSEYLIESLEMMFLTSYKSNIEYKRWCVRKNIYRDINIRYQDLKRMIFKNILLIKDYLTTKLTKILCDSYMRDYKLIELIRNKNKNNYKNVTIEELEKLVKKM